MFKTFREIHYQAKIKQRSQFVWNFGHSVLGFVSDFGIRISKFFAY